MKKYLRIESDGKIVSSNTCIDSDFELQPGYPESVFEIPEDLLININEYYLLNNTLIKLPPKPDLYYVFDYSIKQWVFDELKAKAGINSKRLDMLESSDWTQLGDIEVTTKQKWLAYRQELRDITLQPDYPFNIIWPTPPQ